MDLGEAAKTTQWASESLEPQDSGYPSHTHTLPTHTPQSLPCQGGGKPRVLIQWSLDSATSWSKQEERS